MIYILAEPGYADGIWCKKRLAELTTQLRQRRQSYRVIREIPHTWGRNSQVFLLGADPVWVGAAIGSCNLQGLRPIWLCNDASLAVPGKYSVICTDVVSSMKDLIGDLRRRGFRKIGLYGFNPDSATDIDKKNGFLAALGEESRQRIFYNRGNLEACFRDFMAGGQGVDALICCNNFAAVSLVRSLRQQSPGLLGDILILSYADTRLATLYQKDIRLLGSRSQEYGWAAMTLLDMLSRLPGQTTCQITLHWDIPDAPGEQPPDPVPCPPPVEDLFYQDPQVQQMMQLETLLLRGEVDRCILEGLRRGKPYGVIAEENYLSVNTVKYHVRKMAEAIGVANKQGLLSLLNQLYPYPET